MDMTGFVGHIVDALHYIVPFLIVLSVVVFVHEFGHYWVARRCGVKVESFSLGLGPEIRGWTDRNGTRWKLAWIPFGGYVKMFGDSDPTSALPSEEAKALSVEEQKVAFFAQRVEKRFAIVAAGPVTNYAFGILVLALLYALSGKPFSPPVVDQVLEGSAAAKAGIMVQDRVIAIDGVRMESFDDIRKTFAMNTGSAVKMEIERAGAQIEIVATPDVVTIEDRFGMTHKTGRIGVASGATEYKKLSAPRAVVAAFSEVGHMTASTLKGVGQMILGVRGTEELGGPLRIAQMSGKVASDGIPNLVWFIAVISVNLGLINLFPIPLLDGGHLVFYALEKIRGRAVSERVQEYGARVGALLVLSMMVFATWNDLVQLRVVSFVVGLFS